LLATKENPAKSFREFFVSGDHNSAGATIRGRFYKVGESSELADFFESRWSMPLNDVDIQNDSVESGTLRCIVKDTESKSLVAFPLRSGGNIAGCLTLYMVENSRPFSADVLEFGEVLGEIISMKLGEEEFIAANTRTVARTSLNTSRDGSKRGEALEEEKSLVPASSVAFSSTSTFPKAAFAPDANASATDASKAAMAPHAPAASSSSSPKPPEELVSSLSKQLSWERWVRQIICKLHATLDRDLLLQSVADGFGRSLGASRCLIVRTDGLASPVVTHEYVEPDISPLGLGRTGPFPLGAIMPFRHKAGALPDVSSLLTSGDLSKDEYEYFAENNVKSMAGAPIACHGTYFGVIIILEREASRRWAPQELDMLELVASQTAVAMGHCQSYLQLKDQLFNMNLLGNLTQQLTSTLELVSRGGIKTEPSEEKVRLAMNAPPLSMRELEVLKLIASGLANREIAQRLFLTESTVELHASRIRKKLKLKSRTALVKYACDNGLA
jgi:DNA-binding CsgD family transcriptional regulator/transcriptional regulator with GAF, ATPase, and Fis domain